MTRVKVMSNQRGDFIHARTRAIAREKELDRKIQIESETDRSEMMGIDTLPTSPIVAADTRFHATERAATIQHIQNDQIVRRIAIPSSRLHHSCNRKQPSLKRRHNRHPHSSIRLS